jgi:hypothetical protein
LIPLSIPKWILKAGLLNGDKRIKRISILAVRNRLYGDDKTPVFCIALLVFEDIVGMGMGKSKKEANKMLPPGITYDRNLRLIVMVKKEILIVNDYDLIEGMLVYAILVESDILICQIIYRFLGINLALGDNVEISRKNIVVNFAAIIISVMMKSRSMFYLLIVTAATIYSLR